MTWWLARDENDLGSAEQSTRFRKGREKLTERKALGMFVFVGLLSFSADSGWARQCPTLIKEGRDTLSKIKLPKAEEDKIKALLDEAQKFHDNGDNAASVKKTNEALGILKKK
jgi:hypothetical protein